MRTKCTSRLRRHNQRKTASQVSDRLGSASFSRSSKLDPERLNFHHGWNLVRPTAAVARAPTMRQQPRFQSPTTAASQRRPGIGFISREQHSRRCYVLFIAGTERSDSPRERVRRTSRATAFHLRAVHKSHLTIRPLSGTFGYPRHSTGPEPDPAPEHH